MDPTPPPSVAPPVTPAPPSARKPTRWLLYGCGGLLAVLLIIITTIAITFWWIQRPIKPVVLSAPEKAAVEAKLRRVGGKDAGERPSSRRRSTIPPLDHFWACQR